MARQTARLVWFPTPGEVARGQSKTTTPKPYDHMNADIIRKLEMLKRVNTFILENPITPTIIRATAAHAEIVTSITALETAAASQDTGLGEAGSGVDVRVTTSTALRQYLRNVARTGRSLEVDHPGISATFQLPASGSYPALIARTRSIIAAATPIQAAFVEAGLSATFLSDLQALLTAFETATGQKHAGGITRSEGTTTLNVVAVQGVRAVRRLDASVRNQHRTVPGKIAAWTQASHIERAPRRKDTPAPTSAPAPAPAEPPQT